MRLLHDERQLDAATPPWRGLGCVDETIGLPRQERDAKRHACFMKHWHPRAMDSLHVAATFSNHQVSTTK
jgi:hypothetical protein